MLAATYLDAVGCDVNEYSWDVFVSHNSRQKLWVRGMVQQWRDLGLNVFFDEDSISPGEDIVEAIERGIAASRHIVFVISPSAVKSRWVALETACGIYTDPDATNGKLIPVLLEPTPMDDLRPAVRRLRMIDLTDTPNRTQNYHHLLRFLEVSSPLPPPPSTSNPADDVDLSLDSGMATSDDDETRVSGHTPVEIIINRPFSQFSAHDRERFLTAIGEILEISGQITVVSQRPGSVRLTISIPSEKAQELISLAKEGGLAAYDVTDACVAPVREIVDSAAPVRPKSSRRQLYEFVGGRTASSRVAQLLLVCAISLAILCLSAVLFKAINQLSLEWAIESTGSSNRAPFGELNLLTLVTKGGVLMAPILLMSVLTAALVIERFLNLRERKVLPMALVNELGVLAVSQDGFDPKEAYRICQAYPSSASIVVRSMLLKIGRPQTEVEHATAEASEREASRLYSNVRWLNLVASVAPLIGLFGTVWGMIQAFFQTTLFTAGQNKSLFLAEGIYVALVTTLGGLAVAIPALIFSHYFEGRIRNLFYQIDELILNLLPLIERFEGRLRLQQHDLSSSRPPSAPAQRPVRKTAPVRSPLDSN